MERQRQKQIAKNACFQACRLKDILKDPFQLWLWPHPAQHMLQEPNAPLQSTDRHPVHYPNPEWDGARWQAAQLKVTKLFPFPWRRLKAALTSLTGCPEQRAHCFSGQFSSSKSMCVNVRNSLWLSSECQSLVFFFFSKLESMIWWLKKKVNPFWNTKFPSWWMHVIHLVHLFLFISGNWDGPGPRGKGLIAMCWVSTSLDAAGVPPTTAVNHLWF